MRDSKSKRKKSIQEVQTPRPHKPKLDHLRRKVTKQKKVLKQISSSKELLKKTFLSLDSAAFILDDKIPPRITDCNPAAAKIFGYDREEFLGKTTQFLHINKKALKEFQNVLFPAIEKQGFLSSFEYRMKRKSGNVFPTEHSVFPLKDERNNRIGWISIVRDISARKEVEEQLKQSREFLANTINALDDTFFVKDEEHRWAALNDAACEVIGRPREELIGKSDYDLFPKEQADKFWKKDNLVFETGETNVSEEEVTWHGKLHTISTKKSLFTDFITGKRFIVGTARDITERKQAEEALRQSEQQYRALVEQSLQGIVIFQGFRIVFANATAAKIADLTIEDVLALSLEDMMTFVPPEERADALERLKNRFAGKAVDSEYEIRLVRKNGDEFWLNLFFSPIEYLGKSAIQLAFIDITERKKAEERLFEYQGQLKSLASQLTLAEERERRRIATELHDEISQSLFTSKMKLETLQKSASGKELNETLEEISNSLGRMIAGMRSLTFDLSSPILYEFGFEEAVAEWLNERVEKKHGIETELEVDGSLKQLDDDIRVLLFRDVRELLTNVVKHARAKKIKVSIRKVNSRIYVSVQDDGVGFDSAETESMITKKEAFGLFSIRERLEHFGGNLDIDSAPGCGCRVTITSPLKREDINKDKQK